MLEILEVSKSGYYEWVKRTPSALKERKEQIKQEIQKEYEDSKQIYGAPKITEKLNDRGISIAPKTVGNYMREMGIMAIYRSKWIKTTINSDFSTELENILKRDFKADKPNTIWVTDITDIWTYEGFVYLTSVMDLFSRKIIAWELTDHLNVSCVIDCVNKAKTRRELDEALIIHSDRGSHFVSKEYMNLVDEDMRRSYSKKGDPWDNACIESFHALIKREWLKRFKIKTYNQAYSLVFEYIETFYNTIRIHGSLNYLSPNQFEKNYERIKQSN